MALSVGDYDFFFFTVSNFASDQPNVSTEKQNKLKYTQFCIQNQVYIESLEKNVV